MESAQRTEMNWPNFFVVGAQKAGSTSLYRHLKRHPQIFLPSEKELRFFQPEHKDNVGIDRYRALYAGAKGFKAIGEVSPYYLADLDVSARIWEVCPAARIVIMLRDPVERAYSHYFNYRRGGEPAESFREALLRYENRSAKEWEYSQHYVEHGLYHEQVRRYLDTFGTDQVLVLLFDDLAKNPNELFARIARHIGVDPGFFDKLDVSEIPNPYSTPRFGAVRWAQRVGIQNRLPRALRLSVRPYLFNLQKPPLDDDSRQWLQAFYSPDIARLEELLGRKFPELRRTWV